jgi:hypothetical protein
MEHVLEAALLLRLRAVLAEGVEASVGDEDEVPELTPAVLYARDVDRCSPAD